MKLRHLLCILLTIVLVIGCTACNKQSDTDDSTTATPDRGTNAFGTVGGDSNKTEAQTQENTEAQTEGLTEAPTQAPTTGQTEEPTEESTEERFVYTFEPMNDTVYTTENLNIRREPYNDAEIVTVAAKGTELKRVGYQEYWCQVEYNGETLYAATKYLTTTAPAKPEPEQPTQGQTSDYNKSRPFGYVRNQRDAKNVPNAMYNFVDNWGEKADFLHDTSKKVIYLTMDEGYEAGNTPAILDTLKAKGVKAVFFLTKQFVDDCPQLVQRMIDEGHILGNHTCSHPSAGMPSLSVEEQKTDISKLHNMVLDQFGYTMKLFRFPAGIYSDQSLDVVSSLGYRSVFWSFAYRDFDLNNQPDPTEALKMCMDELHPGAIYLLHAVSSTNSQILGDWIDAVRAQGYEFGVYPVN